LRTWSSASIAPSATLFNSADPSSTYVLQPDPNNANGGLWDLSSIPAGNYWAKISADQEFIAQLQTNYTPAETNDSDSEDRTKSDETSSKTERADDQPSAITSKAPDFSFANRAQLMNYSNVILPAKLSANLTILNPNSEPMNVTITQFQLGGEMLKTEDLTIPANTAHTRSKSATQDLGYVFVQSQNPEQQFTGIVLIESESGVSSYNFTHSELGSKSVYLKQLK
jgi:hypothetical protein